MEKLVTDKAATSLVSIRKLIFKHDKKDFML